MVQVMPSGLVMTRLAVPLAATATNFCCPAGPPQVTEYQLLFGEVRVVHAMPSGLVMTRLSVPVFATATNFSCPAGPPQVTEYQMLSTGEVCVVHVMPSARTVTAEFVSTVANSAQQVMMPKSRRRVALFSRLETRIS